MKKIILRLAVGAWTLGVAMCLSAEYVEPWGELNEMYSPRISLGAYSYTTSFDADDIEYYGWGHPGYWEDFGTLVMDPGGASGARRLYSGIPSMSSILAPSCPYTRSGYKFAGWRIADPCFVVLGGTEYTCEGVNIGYLIATIAAGKYFGYCGYVGALVATWTPVGNSSGGTTTSLWSKARTLKGGYYTGEDLYGYLGTCIVKCGKVNRKGVAKVSVKIKRFDGTRVRLASKQVTVSSGTTTVTWPNGFTLKITGNTFYGGNSNGAVNVVSATIGGTVSGVHYLGLPAWEDYSDDGFLKASGLASRYGSDICFSANALEKMYDGLSFNANGTRWTFSTTDPIVKMTYSTRTGEFKGSIKLTAGHFCTYYPTGTKVPRSHKVTLKVKGAVFDGEFSGIAKYRKLYSTLIVGE